MQTNVCIFAHLANEATVGLRLHRVTASGNYILSPAHSNLEGKLPSPTLRAARPCGKLMEDWHQQVFGGLLGSLVPLCHFGEQLVNGWAAVVGKLGPCHS